MSNQLYMADTHLMKDSEWGMVAYFSQSQYGLHGTDIAVNNINLNNGQSRETREKNAYASVYAVTGLTGTTKNLTDDTVSIGECQIKNTQSFMNGINAANTNTGVKDTDTGVERTIYKWNQYKGQQASSSGNMYGIYDLSGGVWERTASYVANKHDNLKTYGTSLAWNGTKYLASSEHRQVYTCDTSADNSSQSSIDTASAANYEKNKLVYGNAMYETSTAGTGQTAWYSDYSYFLGLRGPFSERGGSLWRGGGAGLFYFTRDDGGSGYNGGFRPVVVAL